MEVRGFSHNYFKLKKVEVFDCQQQKPALLKDTKGIYWKTKWVLTDTILERRFEEPAQERAETRLLCISKYQTLMNSLNRIMPSECFSLNFMWSLVTLLRNQILRRIHLIGHFFFLNHLSTPQQKWVYHVEDPTKIVSNGSVINFQGKSRYCYQKWGECWANKNTNVLS